MRYSNSWRNKAKHADKFLIKIRLGKLTVLDVIIDISSNLYQLTFCNFTIRNN
jgi:hypothetical protein